MTWQKLSLHLPADAVDTIDALLNDAGALAVTLESAQTEELFEPPPGTTPLWQQTQISALFTLDANIEAVLQQIHAILPADTTIPHSIAILPDQDWQKPCLDSFKAVCFADKLWVYPSWDLPVDLADKPAIILDPGLAFGTGAHPTTALCLEWLAQHIKPGQKVIDYGCGSGILAIAALKLGAKEAWAVDNDPQALEATLENAKRNDIASDLLHTCQVKDTEPNLIIEGADVLVANILANPLIHLATYLANIIKRGGEIVLSGILANQADAVMQAYQPWFAFSETVASADWVRLCGKKI